MTDIDPNNLPQELLELLPEELRTELEREQEERRQRLAMIGAALGSKRLEAIAARKNSGIEDEWTRVQDSYEAIDDANRNERQQSVKPVEGGSIQTPRKKANRSTVFLNITAPYVDGAAARMSDMLLPTDDRPWAIRPTPIPDMAGQQAPVAQAVEQAVAAAKEKAEHAQTRIDDWLNESQWHSEVRKAIEDAALLGTGVLKGPTPKLKRRQRAANGDDGSVTLEMYSETVPTSRRVNPWNLYPAGDCGDNIHNGSHFFERDYITAKQLRDLIGVEGYLEDQIKEAIQEGPGKREVELAVDGPTMSEGEKFEIWYFHGTLDKDELEITGLSDEELEGVPDQVPATITMVNDRVIKGARSHLDSGEFPYDVLPWRKREGMPWGTGVGKQIDVPQRMLNAAVRNLMDNAGLSSGPQTVMNKGAIVPADGRWELTARKLWFLKEGSDVEDVRKALMSFDIPSMQNELMGIINFALKMAEDVTGLPMLMQGQQGQAPDTVGGMQILNNNANTVLRRLAKNFDDYITEPHIRRYYEWLMIYGEDEEKGDYLIDARGSSALVERDIQNQAVMQLGEAVMNPAFGLDPKKWAAEMLKSQRLDPKRFQKDEDGEQELPPEAQQHIQELEAMVAELQQKVAGREVEAEARVAVASINARARMESEQSRQLSAAEVAHIRGQYQVEIERLRQELEAIDKEIKIADSETKRGELELQREALAAQLGQHRADMAAKLNQGNPEQVIMNNEYGKVPHAVG